MSMLARTSLIQARCVETVSLKENDSLKPGAYLVFLKTILEDVLNH